MSDDLNELFERDPLHYSDPDIAEIVKRLRLQQTQFELGTPIKAAKTPRPSKADELLKELGLK